MLKALVLDVPDDFGQTLLELVEVLLVEEYLVLVEGERTVVLLLALALRDGEIIVVVTLRGLHVEEVGALACPDRLGEYVLAIALRGTRPFEIVSVHGLVLMLFYAKIGFFPDSSVIFAEICLKYHAEQKNSQDKGFQGALQLC